MGDLHAPLTCGEVITPSRGICNPGGVISAYPEPPEKHITVAVIPSYNEELVIGSLVLRTKAYVDMVIVVDDGSKDRTAEVADLAGARVIRLRENGGKARALMAGFRLANELGCDAAVMLDGDGQHRPEDIPEVARPVFTGEADLVIGSRFIEKTTDTPAYRLFGQNVLNYFTNMSADCKTSDSQSGFRVLSQRALSNLDFASDGYNIESDMISHFSGRGLVIKEVPISVRYDVPHKHKKNPITHGLGVLGNIVGMISYKRPMLNFGIPGAAFTLLGMGTGIYTFSEFYRSGQFHYIVFTIGISALILGLLLLTTGLILNSLVQIMRSQTQRGVSA